MWKILGTERDPDEIMAKYESRFVTNRDYIALYRYKFSFHPVHGLMATYPLKRLRHAEEVFVAGIENPSLAEHLGFKPAESVEEAVCMAKEMQGRDAEVVCVMYPMMVNRM